MPITGKIHKSTKHFDSTMSQLTFCTLSSVLSIRWSTGDAYNRKDTSPQPRRWSHSSHPRWGIDWIVTWSCFYHTHITSLDSTFAFWVFLFLLLCVLFTHYFSLVRRLAVMKWDGTGLEIKSCAFGFTLVCLVCATAEVMKTLKVNTFAVLGWKLVLNQKFKVIN